MIVFISYSFQKLHFLLNWTFPVFGFMKTAHSFLNLSLKEFMLFRYRYRQHRKNQILKKHKNKPGL